MLSITIGNLYVNIGVETTNQLQDFWQVPETVAGPQHAPRTVLGHGPSKARRKTGDAQGEALVSFCLVNPSDQ